MIQLCPLLMTFLPRAMCPALCKYVVREPQLTAFKECIPHTITLPKLKEGHCRGTSMDIFGKMET